MVFESSPEAASWLLVTQECLVGNKSACSFPESIFCVLERRVLSTQPQASGWVVNSFAPPALLVSGVRGIARGSPQLPHTGNKLSKALLIIRCHFHMLTAVDCCKEETREKAGSKWREENWIQPCTIVGNIIVQALSWNKHTPCQKMICFSWIGKLFCSHSREAHFVLPQGSQI